MSLSKANSTSFKKGCTPHNKKCRIVLTCKNCNIKFETFPSETEKRKCCSKKCTNELKQKDYSRDTKACTSYRLAQEGKTIKEISEITGFPPGSISSYLNKMKFRRFVDGGKSYSSVRKKLLSRDDYKGCCVCGFYRIVELAHIIPAKQGGSLTFENTLPLCPNHHHLFDNNRLLEDEIRIINLEKERRRCQ